MPRAWPIKKTLRPWNEGRLESPATCINDSGLASKRPSTLTFLSSGEQQRKAQECCNPLLDCFLCDSRSLLLAVLCLFWPYMGPWRPPLARHPSQPVATLQQGASSSLAAQYLRLAENHTKQVIELYLANQSAELESPSGPPQSSRPTPLPLASTRPPRYRKGYEDEQGVVHFGSDQQGTNYSDSDEVCLPKPTPRHAAEPGRSCNNRI